MRIILDTNVLVSGIFWSGPPFKILELWRDKKVRLITSPEIIVEYQRVAIELAEKFQTVTIEPLLSLIVASSEIYIPSDLPFQVCKDVDDDKFIACAIASRADFVISGDKNLLATSGYQGVKIIKPKEFLRRLTGS